MATATDAIAENEVRNRVLVEFVDSTERLRGATAVSVMTQAADATPSQ